MRHSGRSAPACGGSFRNLCYFVLHEQADVPRHLTQGSGQHRVSTDQRRKAVTMRVPRRLRKAELQFTGKRLPNCQSMLAERSRRAAGTAKLNHQSFPETLVQALAAAMD